MYWFKVNGVSSTELGIIITKMCPSASAARDIESVEVPGRNGNLHIDNGSYKAKEVTIECNLLKVENVDRVKALLEGVISIELSTEEGRVYQGAILNQIDMEVFSRNERLFPLQLELAPLSAGLKRVENITSENKTIVVSGNAETAPIISVVGKGKIAINNVAFETTEEGIILDCDLQECTRNGIDANANVVIDEFPKLFPGENKISFYSGITSISIEYEERWK
ncbi:MAG: hypothetical protein PHC62_03850 [Candidatus Izemoplasmatales bacterium]|nr:hypothetical protein [Candidatus Izemoplasmatales bacterium]